MISIDPVKILLVLVVALVLLGPDKVPAAARQVSSLLADLQRLRDQLHGQATRTLGGIPLRDELGNARDLMGRAGQLDAGAILERLAESEKAVETSAPPVTSEGPVEGNGVSPASETPAGAATE